MIPQINICIPFDPEANLGREYNRIMRESQREWILFLDHDVLLLNPHWYHICSKAIEREPAAGIFTCLTGNIGSPAQVLTDAPTDCDPISLHRQVAFKLWRQKQYLLSDITGHKISGFFLLTSKPAWERAGGFPEGGVFGIDRAYQRRIIGSGQRIFRMDGLYVLHCRDRSSGSWIEGIKTSKELWSEYVRAHLAKDEKPK